jgi:ComF family protein
MRLFAKKLFSAFSEMLSPRHCEVCGDQLPDLERKFEFLCAKCFDSIPYAPTPEEIFNSKMSIYENNDFYLCSIYSLYSIKEDGKYMNLIYSLKYHGFSRVGIEFGSELGKIINYYNPPKFDCIVPVPIHKVRMRERGFNQSDFIAKGVSSQLGVPVADKLIKRARYTQTQTKLSKDLRKSNLNDAFMPISKQTNITGQNILIVDDVFTTGSTINSVAKSLLDLGASSVSAASIALA